MDVEVRVRTAVICGMAVASAVASAAGGYGWPGWASLGGFAVGFLAGLCYDAVMFALKDGANDRR